MNVPPEFWSITRWSFCLGWFGGLAVIAAVYRLWRKP